MRVKIIGRPSGLLLNNVSLSNDVTSDINGGEANFLIEGVLLAPKCLWAMKLTWVTIFIEGKLFKT